MKESYSNNKFFCFLVCLLDRGHIKNNPHRLLFISYFFDYSARIDSTGLRLAALQTGRSVARMAVAAATATRIAIETGPNTKRAIPATSDTVLFSKPQTTVPPITERTTQIAVMMKVSEKNILNTSRLLAPTARRIPISLVFADIETVMKLERRSAANTAITIPA